MTTTLSVDPSTTARSLLTGPSRGEGVTAVEATLRSLIRGSGGGDWVLAGVDCAMSSYPSLAGDAVTVATTPDEAASYLTRVDADGPSDGAVTVIVLNDRHPFFDPAACQGSVEAEILTRLYRHGRRRGIHLFARRPLRTGLVVLGLQA